MQYQERPMIVTLSERKFSEQIRQLEGLDPATTVEEITDRMQTYANRLFEHLRQNYGVNCAGMVSHNGNLGTFQFVLSPVYDDENRGHRIAGLNMMAPNSVTVEPSDLPGLVPPGVALTALEDAWNTYAH